MVLCRRLLDNIIIRGFLATSVVIYTVLSNNTVAAELLFSGQLINRHF